ncbi:NADH-quinone oxidoreductase subunit J [Candidatus Profftella armatura (Diaphorina cf. continua)]|uniref:NADH-quinone oxidoreductase subunit J n=1 Tax=Candidatus Profftella armatura (Diaphorina cf. continua) TaxID=2661583 RepID=A0A7R7AB04_9PROT|nr:NADH-quinone oxidoreductase subunit J [Candidatus Profftella armatura (Diaphorina cf. continua)]BCG49535.1 NADH-quinone oxidoreductase subunit J [Candidatus Profftella armatura (Diaphorina cf. continua)]
MELKSILFYILSIITIISSLCIGIVKNVVHSALFLMLSFFSSAGLWALLNAEFLSLILILIYVGAIMILFLFIIMMLDLNIYKNHKNLLKFLILVVILGFLMTFKIIKTLLNGFLVNNFCKKKILITSNTIGSIKELGILIYTKYIYIFEIASVILLATTISVTILTLRSRKDRKYYSSSDAIKVQPSDRIRVIKMKSENN